ncbi:MAG: AMP-binding protein [Pseudonocardiales bacterium]|nr:AMP-binding protein [Pseudonocardiales bacterium]
MLDGCLTWPDQMADHYRKSGLWRGEALGVVLRRSAQLHPDRVALVSGRSRWRYAQLDAIVDRRAAGLAGYGITAGDRVVVQLPQVAEFVVVCFALWRIGAHPVLCLPSYRSVEVTHLCRVAEPVAYVIPDVHLGFDYRVLAAAMRRQCPSLQHVFVAGDADEHIALDDVVGAPGEFPDPNPSDVAFFLLSGGTTGLPKLIPRTHDDYAYQIHASAQVCGLTQDSVYLVVLPIEFNFPWGCPGVLGTFAVGGTVVLALATATDDHFALIEHERVTLTSLVPSMVSLWLEEVPYSTRDLSSLTLLQVGGAPLHDDLAAHITPTLGCALQQVYGMAEGLLCLTRLDDPAHTVLHTQGRPLSSADELMVVDTHGQQVPTGQVGELLTRGPYTVRGYYRGGEHNTTTFTPDGYYRTGDLVRMLADGCVIVEGRRKDVIIRGGDKICATELENYLLSYPGVRQVAVVALPDPLLGERSCACVVTADTSISLAQLRTALHQRGIADYKLPDRLEIVPQLPMTGLGKVDKKQLLTHITTEVTGQ